MLRMQLLSNNNDNLIHIDLKICIEDREIIIDNNFPDMQCYCDRNYISRSFYTADEADRKLKEYSAILVSNKVEHVYFDSYGNKYEVMPVKSESIDRAFR